MTASFLNTNGTVLYQFFALKTCFLTDIAINLRYASTCGASCVALETNIPCLRFIPKMPNPSLPSVTQHPSLKVESSLESAPEVDQCPSLTSD